MAHCRIATWNVNSLRVRLSQVLDWLQAQQPDILALQETKIVDQDFPQQAFTELGYQVCFAGQKTYNGVAVISREAGHDVVTDLPDLDDPQRRVLGITLGPVRLLNLYVPNGSEVGSEKYAYKLDWLSKLITYTEQQLASHEWLVILGDFNIAPADDDVYDPERWRDKILCSEPERSALQRVLALGLHDTFRRFEQQPDSYSWWDYRTAAFRRNHGLRIDLILASSALSTRCQSCVIDTQPRRLERPSDHAPVLATFDLN